MIPFDYQPRTRIVFGPGKVDSLGALAGELGARRVLLVSDPGIVKAGHAERGLDSLRKAGITAVLFDGVEENPTTDNVEAGTALARRHDPELIVGLGGGSSMDCAKGIGIVISNGRHILDFEGIDHVDTPGPPLICIPTTAGTSADVSQFAIINDIRRRVKITIVSKTVVPDVALIDPVTTSTMRAYLTACTGMDALVHAVEAFVSTAHSTLTDMHALEAIGLIHQTLVDTIAHPRDIALRSKMMMASLHAGLAFSNASLGAVHAMAHSLGGLLDLPHGECNSLLLAPVMDFNFSEAEDRFQKMGEVMGLDGQGLTGSEKRRAVINKILALKESAGILGGLAQRGVTRSDIPLLAKNALQDACMATNPRLPDCRDIEVIYEHAL